MVLAPELAAKGGAERVSLTVAAALRDLGMEVTVVSPGPASMDEMGKYFGLDLRAITHKSVTAGGSRTRKLPNELREVIFERAVVRAISGLRPDVFFQTMYGCEVGALAPSSYYYVHFPHQLDVKVAGVLRKIYYASARMVRKRLSSGGADFQHSYSRVLANSKFTSRYIQERWGVKAEIVYTPCPQMETRPRVVRHRSIVAVGRFQDYSRSAPHKQQDILISAFRTMTDLHRKGWRLHLAGSNGSATELQRLRRMADSFPIDFHVNATFEDLRQLYGTAEIYWHAQGYGASEEQPFLMEHFGITTVEAMSAGVLPLVHDSGGPREIAVLGDSISTWRSIPDLVERTRRIASMSDDERELLRDRYVRRAEEFSPERFVERIQGIVKKDSAA